MNAQRPPLPTPAGVELAHEAPRVTATFTVLWTGGTSVTAVLKADRATQTVPVHWQGTLSLLESPPLATDANLLALYLGDEAKRTRGKLRIKYDGVWLTSELVPKEK